MEVPRFYRFGEYAFFGISAADQRQITAEALAYLKKEDPTGRNPSARWVQVTEAKKAFREAVEAEEAKKRPAQRASVKPHQPPPTQAQRLQAVAASVQTGQGGITATEADAFLASLPPIPHA